MRKFPFLTGPPLARSISIGLLSLADRGSAGFIAAVALGLLGMAIFAAVGLIRLLFQLIGRFDPLTTEIPSE